MFKLMTFENADLNYLNTNKLRPDGECEGGETGRLRDGPKTLMDKC